MIILLKKISRSLQSVGQPPYRDGFSDNRDNIMLRVSVKSDLFGTDKDKIDQQSMESFAADQAWISKNLDQQKPGSAKTLDQQNLMLSGFSVNSNDLNEMLPENSRPHLQNVMEKLEFLEIDEILVDLLLSQTYPSTDDLINKRLCLSTEATLPSASKDIASGYSMHHSSKCYYEPVRRPTQPEPWPPAQTFTKRVSGKSRP